MSGRFNLYLSIILLCVAACGTSFGQWKQNKVDAFVRKQMTENHIPGASLLVKREGKVIYQKSYGFANLELSVRAEARSVYAIGSITKSFTAIGVMLLAEDGKLSIDDPVIKYLPNISPIGRNVTIRQLLNHTSGIRDYIDRPEVKGGEYLDDTLPDYEDWIKRSSILSRLRVRCGPIRTRITFCSGA